MPKNKIPKNIAELEKMGDDYGKEQSVKEVIADDMSRMERNRVESLHYDINKKINSLGSSLKIWEGEDAGRTKMIKDSISAYKNDLKNEAWKKKGYKLNRDGMYNSYTYEKKFEKNGK